MSKYKLTYFDMRGRAEPIRILFTVAGVPFEDCRVRHEDFPKLRQSLPYGQLPLLQFNDDGHEIVLSQSTTIGRFLARKFGFYSKNEVESAKIDEIIDAANDHGMACWACYNPTLDDEGKTAAIKKFLEVATPKYFSIWNKILETNGDSHKNFVGSGHHLTWADIFVFNHIEFFSELMEHDLTQGFPLLKNFVEHMRMDGGIQTWIQKRPKACVRQEEAEYDKIYK